MESADTSSLAVIPETTDSFVLNKIFVIPSGEGFLCTSWSSGIRLITLLVEILILEFESKFTTSIDSIFFLALSPDARLI